jgi:tRNA G10  N-methylase Trm11
MLKIEVAGSVDVILEPSCGYGAFFETDFGYKDARFIGADVDPRAVAEAKEKYPHYQITEQNALYKVSRQNYNISDTETLAIVGNPPYNDKTSHVKNRIKTTTHYEVDSELQARDIGLSSLLAYAKLRPDYAAILHPLSYLIKKTNFNVLKPFMITYKLVDALVFSSQEFAETSTLTGFPVLIAIYRKDDTGTTYNDIQRRQFKTLEGDTFSLSQYDYISNYVYKYPSKYKRADFKGYYFYTMRDINALKRSRTFLKEDIPNAIQIKSAQLKYFHYIDVFKDYAKENLPYYLGNLEVMIDDKLFLEYERGFEVVSKHKHSDIFGECFDTESVENSKRMVGEYFEKLFHCK